jgi:two-component system, LytTR family, sensor kinase
LKKKLYTSALITSPILALYGSSPLYMFDKIDVHAFIALLLVFTANIFVIWVIHIWYVNKYPNASQLKQFIITYLISLATRSIMYLTDVVFDLPQPALTQKNLLYPVFISLAMNAVIMVVVNSIVTAYKKASADKQIDELKLQNIEAQKQLLNQQLQPHFLFNSLSTLKSLVSEDTFLAENYTLKLADFLRYSLQHNKTELIDLASEVKFTQDFIDLQKMRYDSSIDYNIDIPKEYNYFKIPILALQILVENIFKHNYFTEKNKLIFSITCIGDSIIVSNLKTAIKPTEHSKTGLMNLNKRYELICNQSIRIDENDREFKVTLPLIKI